MNLDDQIQIIRIVYPQAIERARKQYEEEKKMSVDLNNWQNMFNIIRRIRKVR